jgi:hypothetical protein
MQTQVILNLEYWDVSRKGVRALHLGIVVCASSAMRGV